MKLKRFNLLISVLLVINVLLTGCGSKKQIENLSKEIKILKNNNKELNDKINNLKEENKKITNKNEKLKEDISIKQSNGKIAYLTFDDGPSQNTGKILDILKQNHIKATFFVNGHPNLVNMYKRIAGEGHTIGNHTYSHNYKTIYKTIDGFKADEKKLDDFLISTIGHGTKILRFPGGSNNHVSYKYGGKGFMNKLTREIKKEGIVYFDWNFTSADSDLTNNDKGPIINSALKGVNTKKVVLLMHDSRNVTVEALPAIILGFKERGFNFEPLTKDVTPVQYK